MISSGAPPCKSGLVFSAASAGLRRGTPDEPTTTGRPTPDGYGPHRSSMRSPSATNARSPSPAGQERQRQDDHQRDHGGAVLSDPIECLLQHGRPLRLWPLRPACHVMPNPAIGRRDRRLPDVSWPRRPQTLPQSTRWCSLALCYGRVRITTLDGEERPCPPGSMDTVGTPRAARLLCDRTVLWKDTRDEAESV